MKIANFWKRTLRIVCLSIIYLNIFIVFINTTTASAASIPLQPFENSIFGIAEISHFGIEENRIKQLSAGQKEDVLLAKEALLNLLKSIQYKDGKPQLYLSEAMNSSFPTKKEFVQSLIGEETSLLAMMISNFSILETEKSVDFYRRYDQRPISAQALDDAPRNPEASGSCDVCEDAP